MVNRTIPPIDEKKIRELAMIQCTMSEIAAVMDCSVDTLERRFADVIKKGQEQGKCSLRRAQYKKAMEGNPAMLIWVGKHILKQRDEFILSTEEPQVRELLKRWEQQSANPVHGINRQLAKQS